MEGFPLEVKIAEACFITRFGGGVLDPKRRCEDQEHWIPQLLPPEARVRWTYTLFRFKTKKALHKHQEPNIGGGQILGGKGFQWSTVFY